MYAGTKPEDFCAHIRTRIDIEKEDDQYKATFKDAKFKIGGKKQEVEGQGETKEDAVKNLLMSVRGTVVQVAGGHSHEFNVPYIWDLEN